MAEHAELLAELPSVEKMTTQERLKHAKKRRAQQLKTWSQREKDYSNKRSKILQNKKVKKNDYKVHFDPSVMLLEAAARNDIEEVERLLLLSVDPDSTNEDGLTALHQCCIDNSEELMRLLIEFGANVNAEDSERWTPLHAAATCGHLNLARYLINKGANLLAVNADGNMPYDICEDDKTLDYIESEMAKRGITQKLIDDTRISTEMQMLQDLKWLADNDGDLDFQESQGETYLHIAAANGYLEVVRYLLENGANPNIPDSDSWQPIHAAACWGHPDILEVLFQHGADINAETRNGETPLDICEDPDLKDRIQQLQNELEIRKLSQQTRLRRTQSQNTRSHSVRRTSLRDKSQISWKEAREEAKIRLDKQENISKDSSLQNPTPAPKVYDTVSLDDVTLTLPNGDVPQPHKKQPLPSNDKIKKIGLSEERKEQSMNTDKYEDSRNQGKTEIATVDAVQRNTGRFLSHNGQGNENNPSYNNNNGNSATAIANSQSDLKVDVNIHLTVNGMSSQPPYNSNTGTLADLKKYRSEYRNRTNSIISNSLDPLPISDIQKSKVDTNNTVQSLSSPSTGRRVFYEKEVIGPKSKHVCCSIM